MIKKKIKESLCINRSISGECCFRAQLEARRLKLSNGASYWVEVIDTMTSWLTQESHADGGLLLSHTVEEAKFY